MKRILGEGNNCGKLMMLTGVLLLVPLTVLPFYPAEIRYALCFLMPSAASIALGLLAGASIRQNQDTTHWQYTLRSGSLTVLFAWIYGFVLGALPFAISGRLTFVQSLFEAVSGWTTTGLSVMDVAVTPQIFLFHRSFMQFCGGLGFVMMMVVFIQNGQAMTLYNAEGHPDKLAPNLGKTAKTICTMFLCFLFGGTLLYVVCGMNLFDSVCHTMGALSTGGFSTKTDSIGAYNSLAVEAVTIVLMLLGTSNFAVLLLLTRLKFRQVFKVSEVRFLFVLIAIFVPVVAFSLFYGLYAGFGGSLRLAVFNAVSALSTTGYSLGTFNAWPPLAYGCIILLMLIGGGIGSTAGGIKLTRVYLLLRLSGENIRKKLSSSRQVTAPYYMRAQGKTYLNEVFWMDIVGFAVSYLFLYIAGTVVLTVTAHCSLENALFEFASSLGTVGLSVGLTGPATNAATLLLEMLGMMLGRLEIFVVFVGIVCAGSAVKALFYKRKTE